MKIRIKNDAPKSVKCYMKEMKSLCESEQVLCKIFMSNKVQILLERYPGRKQYPNRTEGKKKVHDQLDWQKKRAARIYWQILSHLQDLDGYKFQVPRRYRQQSKEYSCQVLKSISHINFEVLKELYLGGNGIVCIESIAFANMLNVEKITFDQCSKHYKIKSFAKTNFNRLKFLRLLRSYEKFAYDKARHLNRARFNMIEKEEEKAEYSDQQEEKQEIKQLRTIMKEYAFAKHLISLSVKIPCNKLDYSMFEPCTYSYDSFKYESKALCISVSILKLVGQQ